MNKALYLSIVFLLPIIFYPIGLSHFQDIWIWYYVPFGAVYATYIWFKPTGNITNYIVATPLVFLLVLFIGVFVPYGFNSGIGAAFEFLPVMLIVTIPIGFITGLLYVVLALLILKGFVKFGYGFQNS
ncbi:hypothetical protein HUZ36_15540 [Pseudoalteromonas sp. McH1-7]|uniref:hypothetical protein n=1 Tax=Pseudoalteromonas sp. McH1-7 TaxID=2745574 RepID=UPI001591D4E0|nr:hypothetical protein [Pseudoalteromonas sp. McH1-7]NUZ12198.1 hypothetical protein [Pseudoalteromonas sp. McH1-7]